MQIGQSLHEDNMIYELEQCLATLTNNNDKLSVRLKIGEIRGHIKGCPFNPILIKGSGLMSAPFGRTGKDVRCSEGTSE